MAGRKIYHALLAGALAVTAGCAGDAVSAPPSGGAEALRAALDDEYRAEATYAAVITAFGEVRPFINIIEAERRHAGMAKAEFE